MGRLTTFGRAAAAAALFLTLLAACSGNDADRESESASALVTPASTASASPEAAKEPGSKGFLWKISGGRNAGYLAGTIHVARQSMYPLDADFERAIDEANYVALELDLTKVDEADMLKLVNEKALLTDGTTLKDHVEAEDYEKFESVMKKTLGAGAAVFDKYEPWYAAMTLESLPAMIYLLTDGIDKHIAKQAHKDGKTVLELESAEEQLALFDGFADKLQRLYFHETVEGAGQATTGLKELLDMWTKGDLDSLEQMHAQYSEEGKKTMGELFGEYNELLLDGRNEAMADKIDDFLKNGENGTYLVAVGSLHMVGDEGLVALLEKKGYKLEYID